MATFQQVDRVGLNWLLTSFRPGPLRQRSRQHSFKLGGSTAKENRW